MPGQSTRWFHHLNIIYREFKVLKLLIVQFSLVSCYFLGLRPKYVSQHHFLLINRQVFLIMMLYCR
jgi:hypothetical protein